ncbi:glutamate-5-semialdehyde dehydrogenase [Leptolyngbya sp. AN02str]|uniref:glutamate-5-semialdehyde dehydrogenase n=1 Tax=Leptolyngbya sp. AN02str TaxID=3423363 RepID=UPI003D312CA1
MNSVPDWIEVLRCAHRASLDLAVIEGTERSAALQMMAKALKEDRDKILEANTMDLETGREMALPDLVLDWLKLTPERLNSAIQILQRLSELTDPVQQLLNTPFQVENAHTYCQLMPLGVIALVYEAFPELGAIAAGLCIRTGNSLVLRGSSEASHSNQAIAESLQFALEEAGMPLGCVGMIPPDQGDLVQPLITQEQYINLVIPYGRTSLVKQVVRQATVPVLKTAIGNCYLYWSPSGSLETARWMVLDSYEGEPDPVNAIEKVLVHRNQDLTTLQGLWRSLREAKFQIRGDEALVSEFPDLILAEDTQWSRASLDRTILFKVVDDLDEAILWINAYSSGHADCLATESYTESYEFARRINSAVTYINTSPRFHRNPARGMPISLGMSNQKGQRRGIISLESLTTVKHVVQGNRR